MKKYLLLLFMMFFGTCVYAQHIEFCGVPVDGDIRDIVEPMRQAGFSLKKKVVDDHYYIFKGTFCEHSSYLQVNYTSKSHTVYQIKVTPSHIDVDAYLQDLKKLYGEPVETAQGYKWEQENGGIFFFTPEGIDPFLYIIDSKGFEVMKEEKNQ